MPGRQAHGRPLMPGSATAGGKRKQQRSKAKSSKTVLDAYAMAQGQIGDRQKQTPRNRELDADLGTGSKRGRRAAAGGDGDEVDGDDDEDDDDDDEGPPRKMWRGARDGRDGRDGDEEHVEYGSDSSGNEWRVGVDEDDDSEIDSDDAFGEDDENRYVDYTFGRRNKNKSKTEEEEEDDDGASLGSDAMDLADVLDMSMSEDNDSDPDPDQQDSDASTSESASDSDQESWSDSDEEPDEEVSDARKKALLSQWEGFDDGGDNDEADADAESAPAKPKLDLADLDLGTKNDMIKSARKLINKENKSSRPQKVHVPLERRQQARIDRAAAYEQTNKTLDRWTETVKHNRRAEHLVFPLPQTDTGLARHDNSEIQPLNHSNPGTELEQTILSIMDQSGLGPKDQKESQKQLLDDDNHGLSKKELWTQRRRERELKSREEARAKRIKKIKSKAFHRVHRKQKERDEIKLHEAMVEAGEVDSEEERERQDRQRAMERMGARHRESKWAKQAKKGGRTGWDDEARMGINEMARRDEELRRRIDGRGPGGKDDDDDEDDDSDYSEDSEDVDDRKRLLQQLDSLDDDNDDGSGSNGSGSKLMKMAFMQKAEAARKQANDDMVKEIRRELASDAEEEVSEDEAVAIGRRTFGQPSLKLPPSNEPEKPLKPKGDVAKAFAEVTGTTTTTDEAPSQSSWTRENPAGDAWSSAAPSQPRMRKGKADANIGVIDVHDAAVADLAPKPKSKPRSKAKKQNGAVFLAEGEDDDDDNPSSENEVSSHRPVQFTDQELLEKAFAGADVVADFEEEKRAQEEEDDEKIIDNTLPGWGSWVGDGISAREKRRHKGRFLTKQEGIKKKDRKDAKLEKVIISEKGIKKNNKYLASQLPHPFESAMQYERSLRLPVGPEWVTKETFQDATKPRVMVKQGSIIAPIAKPMH